MINIPFEIAIAVNCVLLLFGFLVATLKGEQGVIFWARAFANYLKGGALVLCVVIVTGLLGVWS